MMIELEAIRRELNVTWEDVDTDKKLRGACDRAEAYLNMRAGRALDYAFDQVARQLLFDLIKYINADAFAQFAIDYESELLNLRLMGGIKQNAETKV